MLRPLEMGDAEAIAAASHDDDVNRFTFIIEPLTVDAAQQRVGGAERRRRTGEAVRLAIIDRQTERFLGETGFALDRVRRAADLWYWLDRAERGRGRATAVLRHLCRWLTVTFDLGRLELRTEPDNVASMNVATKVGFRKEGMLRGDLHFGGQQHDAIRFGLLPCDLSDLADG